MIEEELPLSGPANPTPKRATKQAADQVETPETPELAEPEPEVIRQAHANLSGLFDTSASPADVLDAILGASSESLIPWEDCQLPSGGIWYDWPDGLIKVRAMTQSAEKILANDRLQKSGQAIEQVFRECCKFPNGFDPADLLVGDRTFLLFFLRGITYGNLYEFAVTCTNCGEKTTSKYNLNELASTIRPGNPRLGKEPFEIRLPYLSDATKRDFMIGIRFLRAADLSDIIAKRQMRRKMFAPGVAKAHNPNPFARARQKTDVIKELDDSITENIERTILHVMGVENPGKIKEFVAKMHSTDSAAIREWLKENSPSIDTSIDIACQSCNHEMSIELPITDSFFRQAK